MHFDAVVTAATLLDELIEVRDEKRMLHQLVTFCRLITDEPGFAALSKAGAEPLFELISQRYVRLASPLN